MLFSSVSMKSRNLRCSSFPVRRTVESHGLHLWKYASAREPHASAVVAADGSMIQRPTASESAALTTRFMHELLSNESCRFSTSRARDPDGTHDRLESRRTPQRLESPIDVHGEEPAISDLQGGFQ